MDFIYLPKKGMGLTSSQEELLSNIESADYKMAGFPRISSLRKRKGYQVVISDKGSFRITLEKKIQIYKAYADNKRQNEELPESERLSTELLYVIIARLEKQLERLDGTDFPLLGMYCGYIPKSIVR